MARFQKHIFLTPLSPLHCRTHVRNAGQSNQAYPDKPLTNHAQFMSSAHADASSTACADPKGNFGWTNVVMSDARQYVAGAMYNVPEQASCIFGHP